MDQNELYNQMLWKQDYVQRKYEDYKRTMPNTEAMKAALRDVGEGK